MTSASSGSGPGWRFSDEHPEPPHLLSDNSLNQPEFPNLGESISHRFVLIAAATPLGGNKH